MSAWSAGIDIGGTTTHVVLVDESGRIRAHASALTPARDGGEAIMARALDLVEELVHEHRPGLAAVGVGTTGVVDTDRGRVLIVSDSFRGWAGFDIPGAVHDRLGLPTLVHNDVNAFMAGEMAAGAGRRHRNALGIMLGTGVGGALWLDGRLFPGPHGAAGEIGHMPGFGGLLCTCGAHGHLETLASGPSISKAYLRRTRRRLTSAEVAAHAHDADEAARAVFEEAGDALGRAIIMATALTDVDAVIIGGGVSAAWPLFSPALFAALDHEPPVRGTAPVIVPTELGKLAVAVGAASLAGLATAA